MQDKSKKYSHLGGIDVDHDYCVKIYFQRSEGLNTVYDSVNNWNECCAKVIEMFGLPGEKYTCRFLQDRIEFWFLEEKDAIMFELCCG